MKISEWSEIMKVFIKKTIVNREEFLFIINEEKSILEDLMDLESGTVEENSLGLFNKGYMAL